MYNIDTNLMATIVAAILLASCIKWIVRWAYYKSFGGAIGVRNFGSSDWNHSYPKPDGAKPN